MARKKGQSKLEFNFKGFDAIKKQLDGIGGGATERAVESGLKASQAVIARQVSATITPHTRTGATKRSIIKSAPVRWVGDVAEINVGFDIDHGGLPSIFLMLGTNVHGQPHIKPHPEIFNAVYGAKTRKEVREIQEAAFGKVLERAVKNEINPD